MILPAPEAFKQACVNVFAKSDIPRGIGTLGEKTLHAVLKQYIEPFQDNHEIRIGGYVADIVGENGIIEIQTQGFDKLRKKLTAFLPETTVTIAYPIAQTKWINWIEPETGEVVSRRKSTKRGSIYSVFHELYKIKSLLGHPNLRLRLILLEIEEYRTLTGWSKDRKRGASQFDRIPVSLLDEFEYHTPYDYGHMTPSTLPMNFTSRDFQKAAHISLREAQTALNVLTHLNVVSRISKQGRLYVYERLYAPESST